MLFFLGEEREKNIYPVWGVEGFYKRPVQNCGFDGGGGWGGRKGVGRMSKRCCKKGEG